MELFFNYAKRIDFSLQLLFSLLLFTELDTEIREEIFRQRLLAQLGGRRARHPAGRSSSPHEGGIVGQRWHNLFAR